MSGEIVERPIPEQGSVPLPRPSKEQTQALPKCTSEGVGYWLECQSYRLLSKEFVYIGESSILGYQRGREHLREVLMGKKTHPLVDHFEV